MPVDVALIVGAFDAAAGNVNANQHEKMANVADFTHMNDEDIIEMRKAMNARALNQHGCIECV